MKELYINSEVKTIYNKILIAMDNSEDAFDAAKKVIELVNNSTKEETQKEYPEIIAFHSTKHHLMPNIMPITVPSGFGTGYNVPLVDYRKLEEEYKIHGKKILMKTEGLFKTNGIDIETRLITDEKPEDYIENIVPEENIDLVALGSKGEHSKLELIFSGTVAQKVVNEVPCDVLVVR